MADSAQVINLKFGRDGVSERRIEPSMRQAGTRMWPCVEDAIPTRILCSSPQPAAVTSIEVDVSEEAYEWIARSRSVPSHHFPMLVAVTVTLQPVQAVTFAR